MSPQARASHPERRGDGPVRNDHGEDPWRTS